MSYKVKESFFYTHCKNNNNILYFSEGLYV